ncbi:MAG: hydantoinase/oxoprolinase family protein [Alphaproteobacteria bacterium]|nr:hydantoinase/oxoprolinase family protein [Alphaproteobacteria bacterium]
MRVGVEVGGTFTDLVAFDGDKVIVTKVPSTPASPDIGAYNAIAAAGLAFDRIDDLAHGSTVATNAVLERKGARLAFVATKGFRDILFLQRHDRRQIYDLFYGKPEPVVARRDCFELAERINADGGVDTALDEESLVRDVVPRLKAGGYQAVAVCLLNAYANPVHERRVATLIERALPGVFVTCSHDVSRVFREYERASTTTLSAFVQPVINRYLGSFEERLKAQGFAGRFSVMQSNGGRLPAAAMRKSAITALFSGPAAGVVGAIRQAARSKLDNLITFDMGGTSTDVCLTEQGRPSLANETEVDGLPIQTPVLDIVTVGGGGGSIVWIDDGGMLRVGPRSAGADPGPACYGRGGTVPTITDAQVIVGAVRPEAFLGGRMAIDTEAARRAMAPLAEHFKLSIEAMAESAIKLVNANIVRAIQLVSTERGKDPRDFVLMPFGGAGPLHAAHIAAELGVQRICVPPAPGVISAYGLIVADFTKYAIVTQPMPLDDGPTAGVAVFRRLEAELTAEFRAMGFGGKLAYTYTAEMRFVGQAFEVAVDLDAADVANLTREHLLKLFEEAHYRVYFHGIGANKRVEIVSLRVGASAPVGDLQALSTPGDQGGTIQTHRLYDAGAWIDCRHVPAEAIAVGETLDGPAIVSGATATTYIPRGWSAQRDAADNMIMRRS